jgi:hypothetical protein
LSRHLAAPCHFEGRLSLEESFQHFGISGGSGDLVDRYFAMFPEMQPYPDVLRTLDKLGGKRRIALVSNIDDDLLQATPVPGGIDLVCTAERARGYKPDGTLFRYLIANAGPPKTSVKILKIFSVGRPGHGETTRPCRMRGISGSSTVHPISPGASSVGAHARRGRGGWNLRPLCPPNRQVWCCRETCFRLHGLQ